jgi:copper homeostasis protein
MKETSMKTNTVIEVCVDSIHSAMAAQQGGAQRIELCDNLFEGGTTPSAGTIRIARERLSIGVNVMIRPRGGDFCYSDEEFDIMKYDIQTAKELGADGIVLGILRPDGTVDVERCTELIGLARPMSVTFHRAFDVASDAELALEAVIACGAQRLLTSGQEPSAIEGMDTIRELMERARERIIIMPGGGVSARNLDRLLRSTGAKEVHVYVRSKTDGRMTFRPDHVAMGGALRYSEFSNLVASTAQVRDVVCRGGAGEADRQ